MQKFGNDILKNNVLFGVYLLIKKRMFQSLYVTLGVEPVEEYVVN